MSQQLSRRRMLGLAAGSALSVVVSQSLLGCAADAVTDSSGTSSDSTGTTTATSCVLTAALTEGPYFVDEKLYRSDIRTDPVTGAVYRGRTLCQDCVRVQAGTCHDGVVASASPYAAKPERRSANHPIASPAHAISAFVRSK